MKYRELFLVACAGTGILVAYGSMAIPLDTFERTAKSAITLIDDNGDDNEGQQEAAKNCRGDDDDCGGDGGAIQQPQNAAPPANGLFAPGSRKPTVRMN